ncbi:MBL fold metallo-hydrolase [Cellulomonas alba]|uniref:MBL fold metallo-hydrolase n=1 Tax=Cellulomonas alba TaxID=3053467 RepID=A0ABT7SGN8_9CELL|nr:MBL fold metallo-hydrolase [Cellulomonas alba]MDM7855341.1 MBL fold metallo-hydrolase [Cellulomonas alba]
MQLIKHVHSCVSLVKGGGRIVVDPGTFTPDAAEAVAAAQAVLVTHEHFDHVDEGLIRRALGDRPDLRVYGPAALVARWSGAGGQVSAVAPGDRFEVAGFDVAVHGGSHAVIHRDVPSVANVGYLIDGRVYHPGDAYDVPPATVETLLLPTSGPWTRIGDAVDFVRAVAPRRLVQVHEIMLSPTGQAGVERFLSPDALIDVPLTVLAPGEELTV